MPVLTHRGVACLALLAATAVSATFQTYRTLVGTHPGVDRFGLDMVANYLLLIGLALAVRSDRRLVWWVLTGGMTALLVYAVVGYYPEVYRARPMDRVDWLEGTLFTALLALVLAVSVLRLTGRSLLTTTHAVAPARSAGKPAHTVSSRGGTAPWVHRRPSWGARPAEIGRLPDEPSRGET